MEYTIVSGNEKKVLIQKVNELIIEGWKPQGGICESGCRRGLIDPIHRGSRCSGIPCGINKFKSEASIFGKYISGYPTIISNCHWFARLESGNDILIRWIRDGIGEYG